jgi:hypothetical protein
MDAESPCRNVVALIGLEEQEVKAFFFEKKKQKTFMSLGRCWGKVRDSE